MFRETYFLRTLGPSIGGPAGSNVTGHNKVARVHLMYASCGRLQGLKMLPNSRSATGVAVLTNEHQQPQYNLFFDAP